MKDNPHAPATMPLHSCSHTNDESIVVDSLGLPATRRRRRRPAESSAVESILSLPMFRSQGLPGTSTLMGKSLSFGSMSSPSLPTYQTQTPVESSPRFIKSRRMASIKQSTLARQIQSFFKPNYIVRLLGILGLGRLLYSHFCFLSLSHQRTLWMNAVEHKNDSTTALLDAASFTSLIKYNPTDIVSSRTLILESLRKRRGARKQRSRPGYVDMEALPPSSSWNDNHTIVDMDASSTKNAQTVWKDLCKEANMNEGSRVLIVNILSNPTGAAVAKLIAKQCSVHMLVGADPMMPNLRRSRMAFMRVLKELMRLIPSLQMVVTDPGMGLHEQNRMQPLGWLERAQPSHVLLFDPLESSIVIDSLDGIPAFEVYATQQLRHIWQDLTQGVKHLPVRVLHAATPLLGKISQPMGSVSVASWDASIPFSFATLTLPPLSGPGVSTDFVPENVAPVFVDQGLRAVMTGWQRPKQFFSINLSPSEMTTEESLESSIWHDHLQHPFSLTAPSANQTVILETRRRLQSYGSAPMPLPCASQCQETSSVRTCSATAWDQAVGPSRASTAGCEYILYMANFSSQLIEAPRHVSDPGLCRVMYISRKSQLAQAHAPEQSGKVESRGWKLVWLDLTENSYSANDAVFLRIDPSRLFSPSVRKAMHVNMQAFASAPDQAILNIMAQIDRPAIQEGERRYREIRRGTELKRWRALPAEPARIVALFAGTPLQKHRPEKLSEYKKLVGNAVAQRQLQFYTEHAHWVHVNLFRPEYEMRETVYQQFPYEWTSRYFVVHDLTLDAARQLRCDWLQEHWTWNINPSFWNTEDLSLAFILGSMKTLGELGLPTDEPEKGWMPFWNQDSDETLKEKDKQVFLRLMQPREDE